MPSVKAPWTEDQVSAANLWQECDFVHPFTCGTKQKHDDLAGDHPLIATTQGWVCPYCDYHQDWAWDFMLDESLRPSRKEGGA
jgi:hypothetical protein